MTHLIDTHEINYEQAVAAAIEYYTINRGKVTLEQAAREFGLNAIQLKEEYRKRGEG